MHNWSARSGICIYIIYIYMYNTIVTAYLLGTYGQDHSCYVRKNNSNEAYIMYTDSNILLYMSLFIWTYTCICI